MMQEELLRDIVSMVAGKTAAGIVDVLYKKKDVNEFLIAKKLELTINQTRNILYKLADHGIVSFIRKKDAKKGGWYTYFWTLSPGKSLDKFKAHLDKELNKMKSQLGDRKVKRYYYSEEADLEYGEEEALENDFICPETGEVLVLRDNSEVIVGLEENIVSLRRALDEVDKELEVIGIKDKRAKDRRLKLEAKKKEEQRAERRKMLAKKRAAKKAAEEKLSGKKKTKKKVKKKVKKKAKKKVKKKAKKSKNKSKKKVKKSKKKVVKKSKKSVKKKSKGILSRLKKRK